MSDMCGNCRNYLNGSCVVSGVLMEPGEWCPTYLTNDRAKIATNATALVVTGISVALAMISVFEVALYIRF